MGYLWAVFGILDGSRVPYDTVRVREKAMPCLRTLALLLGLDSGEEGWRGQKLDPRTIHIP